MARKICNNKIIYMAGGKELTMRLSDTELKTLRYSSEWLKGENWENKTRGKICNFAIYTLLDYVWNSKSKKNRFYKTFPYKEYDNVSWELITNGNDN